LPTTSLPNLATLSPGEIAAFQSLLRQRLIELGDTGVFVLAADARYGMGLTLIDGSSESARSG
jgi:hypothetical protein